MTVGDKMFMHLSNWAGLFAYPVEIVSIGKRYASVRLLHRTHIGRANHDRGTVKRRVPLWSLSASARLGANVSAGGGRFKP